MKIFSSYVFLFETSNFSVPVNDKITLRFRKLPIMQPVSRRRVPDSQLFFYSETVFVVTELVRGGSLESLLKSKDDGSNEYANVCCKLSDRQLLNIALQVALGMQHLEERKVGKSQKIYLNDNSW